MKNTLSNGRQGAAQLMPTKQQSRQILQDAKHKALQGDPLAMVALTNLMLVDVLKKNQLAQ